MSFRPTRALLSSTLLCLACESDTRALFVPCTLDAAEWAETELVATSSATWSIVLPQSRVGCGRYGLRLDITAHGAQRGETQVCNMCEEEVSYVVYAGGLAAEKLTMNEVQSYDAWPLPLLELANGDGPRFVTGCPVTRRFAGIPEAEIENLYPNFVRVPAGGALGLRQAEALSDLAPTPVDATLPYWTQPFEPSRPFTITPIWAVLRAGADVPSPNDVPHPAPFCEQLGLEHWTPPNVDPDALRRNQGRGTPSRPIQLPETVLSALGRP